MTYDTEKLKSVSIVDYLAKRGIHPKRKSGRTAAYLSMFGKEGVASFMVDLAKNRWRDYHSDQKGDTIDLVMALENCSFMESCEILSSGTGTQLETYTPVKNPPSGVKIVSVSEINDPELIKYFTLTRRINEDVLKKYVDELVVSFPYSKNPNNTHVVGGMKNSLGGYDFRNSYMKLSSAPKSFTKILGKKNDKALVLEGFIDWLSYATYYNIDIPEYTVYVLNGLGQLNLLKPFLENREILFMLDNDRPADLALNSLDGFNVTDMRHVYSFHSDFNSMLQSL